MKWTRIEEQWNSVSDQFQDRWSNLSKSDLRAIDGNRQRLIAEIASKYGISEGQAEDDLEEFLPRVSIGQQQQQQQQQQQEQQQQQRPSDGAGVSGMDGDPDIDAR